MRVLSIETSTSVAGVAIVAGGRVLAEDETGEARRHVEFIAPAVERSLEAAGIKMDELEGIAVSTGPGLFTGMRTGIVYARVLGFVLGIPVTGVSTFDILVAETDDVFPVIDAGRGEVFWRETADAGDGGSIAVRVGSPEEAARAAAASGRVVIGDGTRVWAEVFDTAGVAVADSRRPSARVLGLLGEKLLAAGKVEDPVPIYVRASDAAIGWRKKDRVAEGVVIPWR